MRTVQFTYLERLCHTNCKVLEYSPQKPSFERLFKQNTVPIFQLSTCTLRTSQMPASVPFTCSIIFLSPPRLMPHHHMCVYCVVCVCVLHVYCVCVCVCVSTCVQETGKLHMSARTLSPILSPSGSPPIFSWALYSLPPVLVTCLPPFEAPTFSVHTNSPCRSTSPVVQKLLSVLYV